MIGADVGTFNLVACKRDNKNNFVHFREVNAFIEIPLTEKFLYNMMKKSGEVPLIEDKNTNIAYACGEAAVKMAYTLNNMELKRPMKNGCLNPREKNAQRIMSSMIYGLLDEVKNDKDGEILYYCIPSNSINEETNVDYHKSVLQSIFNSYRSDKGLRVNAFPINEGLALVYAELEAKAYTGLGVSCLVPGTKIYTKRGIVNIEDVNIDDFVITHKGRWRKVNKVIIKNFSGVSTKLQLQGYVNNTDYYKFVDNHELYVRRDNAWRWIGCDDVVVGDIVGEPIIKQNRKSNRPTMTICQRVTCSKEYTKDLYEVTQDIQRLIGYFLGDGSLDRDGIQFDFGIHEKNNINDLQEILLKCFKKKTTICKKGDNCIRIKCSSVGLHSWFKNHCYKDKIKVYPWNLERISKGDCLNLLSGLVRSDGCISNGSISFENTSSSLAILVKQCFSRIGLASCITFREPRKGKPIFENKNKNSYKTINGKKQSWTVSCNNKLNNDSVINIIENINCNNSIFQEKIFVEDGFCCSKIQKIEKFDYNGPVYDLQVEEDHSFSGPQLTIHNCGGGQVNVCYTIYGKEIFKFSIVNSGDWIDEKSAKATGESIAFINQEKMKLDLTVEPENSVLRAIKAHYEIMLDKTAEGIKKGLEEAGNKARSPNGKGIDIVVAGGTSIPKGFDILFAKALNNAKVPMDIASIIRPSDPLYSVARGCCVAAENAE